MPNDKYNDLKKDSDHVNNHPEKRSQSPYKAIFTSSADKPRPSDLGSGMASGVAQKIIDRKRMLDEI